MGLFLAGAAVVFVGALKHAVSMAWGGVEPGALPQRVRGVEVGLVVVCLTLLLGLGLWLPESLATAMTEAARVITGGRP